MEGAPKPSENEQPLIEVNKDNKDLFHERFVFGKGFSPEEKKRTRRRSPAKTQLSARERWEESARRCEADAAAEEQQPEA